MRLLRAFVVVSSVAVAVVAWHYLRPASPPAAVHQTSVPANRATPAPIDPALLPGVYQGPITRVDGIEEWFVLEINSVSVDGSDEVTFAFTLSSSSHMVKEEGRASLRHRWIRFAGMSGEIRTRPDGVPLLRSAPIAGPPNWMLERPRFEGKPAGVTRP